MGLRPIPREKGMNGNAKERFAASVFRRFFWQRSRAIMNMGLRPIPHLKKV